MITQRFNMSGEWENNYNHNNQYKGISELSY